MNSCGDTIRVVRPASSASDDPDMTNRCTPASHNNADTVIGSSNVPLGFVSLTENLAMMAMGLWMLLHPVLG